MLGSVVEGVAIEAIGLRIGALEMIDQSGDGSLRCRHVDKGEARPRWGLFQKLMRHLPIVILPARGGIQRSSSHLVGEEIVVEVLAPAEQAVGLALGEPEVVDNVAIGGLPILGIAGNGAEGVHQF